MLMNNEESQEICGIMFVILNKENSFVPACMWNSVCDTALHSGDI